MNLILLLWQRRGGERQVTKGMKAPLLKVRELKKHFPVRKGLFGRVRKVVRAVDGVSFHVNQGETFGLVGESGCGKSTTARCILRAIEPTDGKVWFNLQGSSTEITQLDTEELRQVWRQAQMIFQDPYYSLNPRLTVEEIISEPLQCFQVGTKASRQQKVADTMEVVGLDPNHMSRYPHAFSGGQRQRIGIARALVLNPCLIVADEPVSALDVSIQAQILNLLQDLQDQFMLTYLFISHDLGVVKHICDRVAVMYKGQLVELATAHDLFSDPKHPYVELLLSAVPRPDPNYQMKPIVFARAKKEVSQSADSCLFANRCPYAADICYHQTPMLVNEAKGSEPEHLVACHRSGDLRLEGVREAE